MKNFKVKPGQMSKAEYAVRFQEELKRDAKLLKKLIFICRDKKSAIEIKVADCSYFIENNKNVVRMLKRERKQIKKLIL